MKIAFFADLHMCPRASIINKWGAKYPVRLENCIESINWVERTAEALGCEYIINLGDFFDKPDLASETITACNEIAWSNIMHYSIVGNHDASSSSLIYNSANSLLTDRHQVISEPTVLRTPTCQVCFLPYVVESDRKPLAEYFNDLDHNLPVVIASHNDINGIQMGPVISKTGFTIDEIENSCDLFLNGHLHNGQTISSKIINLGNLTGKDFGEDAFKHKHQIAILDTDTMQVTYIENPNAYNFYKLQIETEKDLAVFNKLKPNAVVSIKCDSSLVEHVRQLIDGNSNIIDSRLVITKVYENESAEPELDLSVDHLARFVECCKTYLDNSKLLDEEISEVCK